MPIYTRRSPPRPTTCREDYSVPGRGLKPGAIAATLTVVAIRYPLSLTAYPSH